MKLRFSSKNCHHGNLRSNFYKNLWKLAFDYLRYIKARGLIFTQGQQLVLPFSNVIKASCDGINDIILYLMTVLIQLF